MMMTTHRRSASLSSSWPLVDDDDDDADVDIIAGRSLALLFREQSSSLLREQHFAAVVINTPHPLLDSVAMNIFSISPPMNRSYEYE